MHLMETFGGHLSWREQVYQRKQAISSDLFLTGTNAITKNGQLVNLDMIDNPIGAIAFGPRTMIIFAGANKLLDNKEAAFKRIRSTAGPLNAIKHSDLKTPCQKPGFSNDCTSPQRICNSWLITEKSYPAGRIKIILIDEALGL